MVHDKEDTTVKSKIVSNTAHNQYQGTECLTIWINIGIANTKQKSIKCRYKESVNVSELTDLRLILYNQRFPQCIHNIKQLYIHVV